MLRRKCVVTILFATSVVPVLIGWGVRVCKLAGEVFNEEMFNADSKLLIETLSPCAV